jgi:hypothetical protein
MVAVGDADYGAMFFLADSTHDPQHVFAYVFAQLTTKRATYVNMRDLRSCEDYLCHAYVVFERLVEHQRTLFGYRDPRTAVTRFEWYDARYGVVYASRAVRFELVMAGAQYASSIAELISEEELSVSVDEACRLALAALCICRDVISVQMRAYNERHITVVDAQTRLPRVDAPPEPIELSEEARIVLEEHLLGRLQHLYMREQLRRHDAVAPPLTLPAASDIDIEIETRKVYAKALRFAHRQYKHAYESTSYAPYCRAALATLCDTAIQAAYGARLSALGAPSPDLHYDTAQALALFTYRECRAMLASSPSPRSPIVASLLAASVALFDQLLVDTATAFVALDEHRTAEGVMRARLADPRCGDRPTIADVYALLPEGGNFAPVDQLPQRISDVLEVSPCAASLRLWQQSMEKVFTGLPTAL